MLCEDAIDGIKFKCNNSIPVSGSKLKKKRCGRKYSIRRKSWFFKSHLKIAEILNSTYYWWNGLKAKFIENEMEHGIYIDYTLLY